MCSSKRKLNVRIKIVNFPKILILVFYGKAKFKIKNTIKHGEYELIGILLFFLPTFVIYYTVTKVAEFMHKNIFMEVNK